MIVWNHVIWYSQVLALVLGVAFFLLGFFLGQQTTILTGLVIQPHIEDFKEASSSVETKTAITPPEIVKNFEPLGKTGLYTDQKSIFSKLAPYSGQLEQVSTSKEIIGDIYQSNPYYRDNTSVYYLGYPNRVIQGADPTSFTLNIPMNSQLDFAKDKYSVFYRGQTTHLDISFEIIFPGGEKDCAPGPYVKDGVSTKEPAIYYSGPGNIFYKLKEADAATFQVLWTGFSKDKNHVYSGFEITPYDPSEFDLKDAYDACPIG